MAYRIEYDRPKQNSPDSGMSAMRVFFLFCAFFLIFAFWTWCFWPEGRMAFAELLFPGGAEPAMAAAEVFVEELRNGEPISEALEHFCRDIVAYAHLP